MFEEHASVIPDMQGQIARCLALSMLKVDLVLLRARLTNTLVLTIHVSLLVLMDSTEALVFACNAITHAASAQVRLLPIAQLVRLSRIYHLAPV